MRLADAGLKKLNRLLDYLEQIDYELIQTDEETVSLAEKFIDFGILKQKVLMTAITLRRQFWQAAILSYPGILNTSSM